MKSIILVIAEKNFRDEEYQRPKEVLEKFGFKVITASTTTKTAFGKLGLQVRPDILLKEVDLDQFDAIAFIGGGGTEQYFNDSTALDLARVASLKGKICAAICIAPVILANAGLLENKRATVFASEIEALKAKGALYEEKDVVVDGLLVTANGPLAAEKFGEELAQLLKLVPNH